MFQTILGGLIVDKHCMLCLNPHNHFPGLKIDSTMQVCMGPLSIIIITFKKNNSHTKKELWLFIYEGKYIILRIIYSLTYRIDLERTGIRMK